MSEMIKGNPSVIINSMITSIICFLGFLVFKLEKPIQKCQLDAIFLG